MKTSSEVKKIVFSLCAILLFPLGVGATTLAEQEQAIAVLFDSLKTSENDSVSGAINTQIEHAIGDLLANDSSFSAPLDSLKYMGKCYSDNGDLRLYTWTYPLSDKTYGYGGYIQFKPTKKRKKQHVKPIALTLSNGAYLPQAGAKLTTNQWYGALYYNAIATKKGKEKYYIVLGWAGNDGLSDYKVAETLKITNNDKKVTLGGVSPFKGQGKPTNRIVMQYSNDARVAMDYDPSDKRIIMDHLTPTDPFYTGIYSYYGPDFTYDAYQYDKKSKGMWLLKENIDAKNR